MKLKFANIKQIFLVYSKELINSFIGLILFIVVGFFFLKKLYFIAAQIILYVLCSFTKDESFFLFIFF